jgi:hypothetical protein
MGDVLLKKVTYGQLKCNNWLEDNDLYGLASFVDDNIRATFLDSSNNDEDDKTAVLFAIDDGIVVGRHLLYGTSIKKDNTIVKAQSSGSTEVHESQRGKGIGTKINKWTLNNEEYPIYICSLLSAQCLSLMRKKENDCTIFDFPRFVKIVNTEPIFVRKVKAHVLQKIGKSVGNSLVWLLDIPNKFRLSKLKKIYKVLQLEQVPDWAGDMCLNDGHKYAEYHDSAWLQWCLTHNLSGRSDDIQRFYAVYKQTTPVGFFFTKERMCKDEGYDKEFLYGTICEWASVDEDLGEADLNLLATETFSRNCFHILTVTDNPTTEKSLRRLGFLPHGSMQMGFKDKQHQHPDMCDQSLWRIRFGCCNSILY